MAEVEFAVGDIVTRTLENLSLDYRGGLSYLGRSGSVMEHGTVTHVLPTGEVRVKWRTKSTTLPAGCLRIVSQAEIEAVKRHIEERMAKLRAKNGKQAR